MRTARLPSDSISCADGQNQVIFRDLVGEHTYHVDETGLPENWQIGTNGCTDLYLNPAQGTTRASCTITNTVATISIQKLCNVDTGALFDIYVGGQLVADDIACDGVVTPFTFPVDGPYVVRETLGDGSGIAGLYVVSFGDNCATGSITPVLGQNRRCAVTNTYVPVDPSISTQVSQTSLNIGDGTGPITDQVTVLDGDSNGIAGSVTFSLCYSPDAFDTCATGGSAQGGGALDGNGQATSSNVTPTLPGYYCFGVDFTPDNQLLYNAVRHYDDTTNFECFQVTAPDTDIVKTGPTDPVPHGTQFSYTLAVTNNGDGPTNADIVVTDTLPDGLTNVTAGGTDWVCDPASIAGPTASSSIECTYSGSIAAGASAPDITVTATAPVNDCDNLDNTAVVSGADAGSDTAENSSTVTTNVDGCISDLDISKSGDTAALFGDTVEYLIEVFNAGSNPANDVVVTR